MRNLLDRASIAQNLDGARLKGCLHYPYGRIFRDPTNCKDLLTQQFSREALGKRFGMGAL